MNGEAFDFGPPAHQNHTVKELVDEIILYWEAAKWEDISDKEEMRHEAGLLKLNCDKALHKLGWQATLNFKETAKWTSQWYGSYYNQGQEAAYEKTIYQIKKYLALAFKRKTFNIN